ncbi:hypothetical protein TIFTF001_035285 [Ficus carica]|uniref:Uncharacterized protein n=1 Tax=Ficus carica TaxID=3494 RepID=A0AA88JBK0_FICCA|nr:hypothetical protein TIFTF001_035285 [Ficus carica]
MAQPHSRAFCSPPSKLRDWRGRTTSRALLAAEIAARPHHSGARSGQCASSGLRGPRGCVIRPIMRCSECVF